MSMSMSASMSGGDDDVEQILGNGIDRAHAHGSGSGSGGLGVLKKDDLLDDDIELIFDIVNRANDSQKRNPRTSLDATRASRALFTAYDEIFAEKGFIAADDRDNVLHRFLQLLERKQRVGEGLVERFQRVLKEMGIVTEVNEDGDGVDFTTPFRVPTRDALREERERAARPWRERRGSFESFFDGSADKIAGTTDTGQEMPLRGRERRGSDGVTTNTNGDLERWWNRRSRSDTGAILAQQQARLPIRTRTNGHGDRRVASEQQVAGHGRAASVASRGSLRIWRAGRPQPAQPPNYDLGSDDTEQTSEFDFANVQIPGVNSPIPTGPYRPQRYVPEPYRPSDTRLLDDAETFEQQRLHSLTRRCIQAWRERTQEVIARNEELDRIATVFHGRNILKEVMKDWRGDALIRRNNHETERFFGKLETRAEKARNLFLLTKSFTHWATSAEDEVQRTSVARRHILRTRFFSGWREITAVNELKIQHFILGKFLKKWWRRAAVVRNEVICADEAYDFRSSQRFVRLWYEKLHEKQASVRNKLRLKTNIFQKWRLIATTIRDREVSTADHHIRQLGRQSLDLWRQRTTAVQSLKTQSGTFRDRAVLANALAVVQRQARFAPLVAQVRARVDTRHVRSAFQQWRQAAQHSRQARDVDRSRILRNAWTTWNDRLRIQTLESHIDDRVLVETMYRWALASKVSLVQRVRNRSLKQFVFLTWITRTNERRNTLDSAERRLVQFKRTQLLRTSLRKIEVVTAERKAEEAAIAAQHDQKLKQRIFNKLLDKSAHFQQLNKWAGDARFYVLTTRTLKTWKEATQLARRNRRREMYARMRRTVKINLVRRVFGTWKEKTEVIVGRERQATEIARARTLQYAATLLTQIHDRTASLREQEAQVQQQYDDKLKIQHFHIWNERMTALQTMDAQAIALRQENTEIAAQSALKKLGWRLWTVKRQEETAIALHQRNFEKHQRAMIRFWFEQTMERRAARPLSPTPSRLFRMRRGCRDDEGGGDNGRTGDSDGGREGHYEQQTEDEDADVESESPFDNAGEDTQRLEAWTAFDENALGFSNIDLDLSLTPQRNPMQTQTQPPTQPPSSARPPPSASSARFQNLARFPPPSRPHTIPPQRQLQPPTLRSALRPRLQPPPPPPPPVAEDLAFDDPSAFWASTPMPPPPSGRGKSKPGYLKTPSKRSVARSKRPELPASPEKRVFGLGMGLGMERGVERGMGVMSAPPGRRGRDVGVGVGAGVGVGTVKSFERRLAEGGFRGGRDGGGNERGNGRGRTRVEFGDISPHKSMRQDVSVYHLAPSGDEADIVETRTKINGAWIQAWIEEDVDEDGDEDTLSRSLLRGVGVHMWGLI
ncbi:Sfi1-domain-containing protein [Byssothecium circinans]|uniref:Sfi1-domain-containing protein n=1 Tax=Byssothecium circinans TaxID=147558 RepID=A0A6A5U0J2_9PLEO|nr:Sfi1-domain-containing protein [Byssothecium circinans]